MSQLKIYASIDIMDGKCVRLAQGKAHDMTVYSDDPLSMAHKWIEGGADGLHIVDLDGAFKGEPVHLDVLKRIIDSVDVPVTIGGGLRTVEHLDLAMDTKAHRVMIGTAAIGDPYYMKGLTERYDERLAVAIDSCDGFVQVRGWIENTNLRAVDLASAVAEFGVRTIMYTDTSRDGLMRGADVQTIGAFCDDVNGEIVVSGGISSQEDIRNLQNLEKPNLSGVVVGRALYENQITLQSLQEA
ncbi:MAG: phosphoribosylformimino-5-aminoimidazole carboxamide ribotide isomerase [Kiritimatiellia bacterium]|jgi:phosphoribosylformimino-5-aminoimidazole carboxamide ribotide isomerase